MQKNIVYGLVFGGGGAKGAYQLGAWKALEKMKIQIGAVVGASIGSINGALFAQGDLHTAQQAWSKLNLRDVVVLEDDLHYPDNLFDVRNINQVLRSIFRQRGLDMEPIRENLKKYIDEDAVRRSPVDMGVISYDITSRKPVEIFKNDMPEGTLYDYLMASACFPVFKSVEIDGQKFVDGGVYNNLPADMLANRGYKHIIIVDIGGMGMIRNVHLEDREIVLIKPSTPLGGLFDMSHKVIELSIRRGYLDTYRAFGKFTGNNYYLSLRSSARFVKKYGQNTLDGLEIAAQRYGIDPYRIYTPERLKKEVQSKFLEDSQKYVMLRMSTSNAQLRSRLLGDHPRLRKIEKDYLIPAAVDILAEIDTSARALAALRRLMPSVISAAEALVTLGIRPVESKPAEHTPAADKPFEGSPAAFRS